VPVWMGAKNFALTRILTPDPPSRGESLYRLWMIVLSAVFSKSNTFIIPVRHYLFELCKWAYGYCEVELNFINLFPEFCALQCLKNERWD
jgi:hypothetical protein